MEEEVRRERRRAEYMARAAAWQLEKEEAEANKVCTMSANASLVGSGPSLRLDLGSLFATAMELLA